MNLQIISNSLLKTGALGGYSVIELENSEVLCSNLTKVQAEEYVMTKKIQSANDRQFELMIMDVFGTMAPDVLTKGVELFIRQTIDSGFSMPGKNIKEAIRLCEIRGYTFINMATVDNEVNFVFKRAGRK